MEGLTESLTLVQQDFTRIIKGFKCVKRKSVITALCGMFSHSKITSPMDILSPEVVTMSECQFMKQTHLYRTEDDRQIQVMTGGEVIYKYIAAGQVTFSEHNVACQGGGSTCKREKT